MRTTVVTCALMSTLVLGCAATDESSASDPTADPILACDTRAAARAEALARLGLDPAECLARDSDIDVCPDRDGDPVFELTYSATDCAGETVVRVGAGAGWWSMVCTCLGCSSELGFDASAGPRPLMSDWRQATKEHPRFPLHADDSGC